MRPCPSIVTAILALIGQSTSFLQPGIVPIPSLPSNFSKEPEHWVHATPLLDTADTIIPLSIPSFRRREANHRSKNVTHFWRGWEDIHYLFSLYAFQHFENWQSKLTFEIAAIHTRAQVSTLPENSLAGVIHSAIQYTQALPRRTVQITSTF